MSVDAADRLSTGISASDRAHTLRVLADPASTAKSLIRPGHILPLRAVDGGVRERDGHTEAAVDLLKLAGLTPVAAIAEIVDEDGEMMRLPNLIKLGERDDVPVITIEALIALHGGAALRERPDGRRRRARVVARDIRGGDDRADRSTASSACGPTGTARPVPTTSPGSRPTRTANPGRRARSCASTPSA